MPITSEAPSYYYTQLGALKIEMLAEAGRDARTRAERILQSAGGATLGRLRRADMGVININSANSTDVSSEGNNDTTSLEKDILTIVHTSFELNRSSRRPRRLEDPVLAAPGVAVPKRWKAISGSPSPRNKNENP